VHVPGGASINNSNGGGAGASAPVDLFILQPVHDANTLLASTIEGLR
jgi:hypothetical protein